MNCMEKKWYSWLELIVDRLVPYAVIALLFIIIADFFFTEIAEQYHLYLSILDYGVLTIFILDLIFKYLRIRNIPNFLKTCWLDIIAIFPFFIIFRVFESLLVFTELPKEIREFQLIVHAGSGVSEESAKIIREAEEAGKISRVKAIIRMFRGIENSPRIVKALSFYEQPVGKHHLHEIKGEKQYKKIKKTVQKDVRIIEKDVGKGITALAKGAEKTEEAPGKLIEKVLKKKK